MTYLLSSDDGIDKFGYNADVDAAEDIWSGGGDYDWTKVAANAVTTIVSSDAVDGAGAKTGALTAIVEGLVIQTHRGITGGKIVKETVTLTGTDAVTLTNNFQFVYRVKCLTFGSGNANAGLLSVKHSTDVIARVEIGINQTEMAMMIVPHFNSQDEPIEAAYLHNWGASIVANSAANMGVALLSAPAGTYGWAINRRGVVTVANDVNQQLDAHPRYAPGTKIKVRATSVSAVNQLASAHFNMEYRY